MARKSPDRSIPAYSLSQLAIVFCAFVSLGLPDAVTGVAWPSLQVQFGIPASFLGFILAGLSCGYFVSGLFAGNLLSRLGVVRLLSFSCLLVSIAMATNAAAPVWWLLVIDSVVWGLGSGAIDSGLNGYAAKHFPARIMNWLHACYSFGAALGPLIMNWAILSLGDWRWGYAMVSVNMAAMMMIFVATRRLWQDAASADYDSTRPEEETKTKSEHSHKHDSSRIDSSVRKLSPRWIVLIHVLLFFFYTGLEALFGQWAYSLLTLGRHLSPESAGYFVSAYFFAIGIGRVLAGFIVNRWGMDRLIQRSMGLTLLASLSLVLIVNPIASGVSIVVIGLGLAAIFPCLMSRTPERMGNELAAHAIGYQIAAATIGVTAVPGLTGWLVVRSGEYSIVVVGLIVSLTMLALHEYLLRSDAAVPKPSN